MTPSAHVGYVVKRYPRFSETFIVNEILAHEEMGREIDIFALRSVDETHFQDILARVRAPVTRVPDRFRGIEDLWALQRDYAEARPEGWSLLTEFPEAQGRDIAQAIIIALACEARGIAHLHAHFGTVASTVTRIAARLAGITWSMTLHAKDIFCDYEENQNLDLKLRDANGVVTVSDFNVDYLSRTFPDAKPPMRRVYNGIDMAAFDWQPPAPEAQGILAVGRLVEKKGFHILIEALRILRDDGREVTCRIIGSGEEDTDLRAQMTAARLGDSVTFEGSIPQVGVKRAMREAAVMACPCIVGEDGNRDGMPTVLLEAMALGLPCIGTNVTGIPELINDGVSGFVVPEGDTAALAKALARLLDDADLRARFSRAGREVMERDFDIRRNVPLIARMFDDAVAHAQAGPAPRLQAVGDTV